MASILLVEGIHIGAAHSLTAAGFKVDRESGALAPNILKERLPKYEFVGIRSKTELSKQLLENNKQLIAIGAFCIGTNQINLEAANRNGTPVFNAPYSNTRSVAEMVIAEMVILARQLGDRNLKAHQGGWMKSANGAREIRGKTLGIVGYGHIGSQVSVLAEAMGLRVLYFDVIKKLPMGNARACEHLSELLHESDFVTLHVPETPQTKNMIAEAQLEAMKPKSFLINASRGTVVDIEALARHLKAGHLAGAAIDVFPQEPERNEEMFASPLQGLPNVFLTPHIGGSTEEAQAAIGLEVSQSLIRFAQTGSTVGAVNFPNIDVPPLTDADRIVNVHRNVPGVLRDINKIVSEVGANIKAQYLSTNSDIGYLVMDIEQAEARTVSGRIAKLETSIQTRLLSGEVSV